MASSLRSLAANAMRSVRTNESPVLPAAPAAADGPKPSVKISDLHFEVDVNTERQVALERSKNRSALGLDE